LGRYITYDDLVDRYRQLANDSKDGSTEVGSAYIVYAENELDGMLASTYTVPFSSNNLTAKDLSIDLAYLRIGRFKDKGRKELKADVMERINMLKSGEMGMLTDAGEVLTSGGQVTAWSNTKDYHPVFGMGDTIHFDADSQQVIDEENDRGRYY